MFALLKDKWWTTRPARLAGLFAFEFSVVVAGLLTAQWLQDRAEAARERKAFGELGPLLERQAKANANRLASRAANSLCALTQLSAIDEALRTGNDLKAVAPVRGPSLALAPTSQWTDKNSGLAIKFLRPEDYGFYSALHNSTLKHNEALAREQILWPTVALVSSEGISEFERSEIRLASLNLREIYKSAQAEWSSFAPAMAKRNIAPDWGAVANAYANDPVCGRSVKKAINRMKLAFPANNGD